MVIWMIVESDLELGDASCSAALEMEYFGKILGAEPMHLNRGYRPYDG